MYSEYTTAGNGLKTMFIGQIVSIVAAFFAWIPILGAIAMIAGGIIVLVGLNSAGPAHPGYKNAMYMVIVGIVLSIISAFAGTGFIGGIMSIAVSVVAFLETYFICTASGDLLSSKGDAYQADRSALIWKLYAACTAVGILCILVSWIPILNVLAALASVIMGIVEIVAGVLLLIFLYKASQSLLS